MSTTTKAPATPRPGAHTVEAERRAPRPGSVLAPANDDGSVTAAVVNAEATERAAVAARSAEALAAVLKGSRKAAADAIERAYGTKITVGAVTIAERVALTLAGDAKAAKYRGETRASVLRVLALLAEDDYKDARPTDDVLVSASMLARERVSAATKAATKAAQEERAALLATTKDAKAGLTERREAFEALAALDAKAQEDAKRVARAALEKAFAKALETLNVSDALDACERVADAFIVAQERAAKDAKDASAKDGK